MDPEGRNVHFSSAKLLGKMIVREALTLKLLPTTKNYFISHLLRIFHEVLQMWMLMVDDSAQVFGILYPWLVMGSTILPTICAIPLTYAKQITAYDAGQKEAKHNHMITNSWQSMKSRYQVIKPGNQNLQMPQKGQKLNPKQEDSEKFSKK